MACKGGSVRSRSARLEVNRWRSQTAKLFNRRRVIRMDSDEFREDTIPPCD